MRFFYGKYFQRRPNGNPGEVRRGREETGAPGKRGERCAEREVRRERGVRGKRGAPGKRGEWCMCTGKRGKRCAERERREGQKRE